MLELNNHSSTEEEEVRSLPVRLRVSREVEELTRVIEKIFRRSQEYKNKDVKYGSLFTTWSQLLTLLRLTVLMSRDFKEESRGSHSKFLGLLK